MDKIIFVYGAENFAARQLTEDLSKSGYRVYAGITDGNQETADYIRGLSEQTTAFLIDPTDLSSIEKAADHIKNKDGHIDILVLSAEKHCTYDGEIGEPHNYDEMLNVYDFNVNGVYRTIQTFLPLLRLGEGKRIAVLSHRESSINYCQDTDDYAYHMSLAAINMMEKIYFNALRPEGFTFRNYCVSDDEVKKRLGMNAKEYILRNLCYDSWEPYIHSEENRLVMRDCFHREVPW